MKIYVSVRCEATYNGSFEVPDGMTPEEAVKFAQAHINEIPRQNLAFVPGTARLDQKGCRIKTGEPVIRLFRGENAFLSNFYECPVIYDGLEFGSAEAAFQAAKCECMGERMKFISLDPNQAKRLGRHVRLRSGWDEVKLMVMRDIMEAKFRNPELKRKLLATGDATLIEGNYWGDSYWGITKGGTGEGENHLGRILMPVRQQLRKEEQHG